MRTVDTTDRADAVTLGHDAVPPIRAVAPATSMGRGAGLRLVGDPVADEAGLRAAFLAYGSELLGFARRSLRGSSSAEDVVQETFARAWRSRHRYDPDLGSLRTWLFAIERRALLDVVKRQSRQQTEPLSEADGATVEDRVDAALLSWQLATVLERLDDDHRLVITELYFNGRTSREVSSLFGIPEGTVRSRAYYALRTLRAHLEDVGWNP
ncbi:MAG TPA: sigma-70 family RNA polymerase sigma factor [Acidimicrobiales bacterium]|jgi:RNA polymerase sigma-70 factor (ECF subfamily)|nr:sigma-70 family RNA polymerase sigma factor [Acidimicrobiales bacterium]